MARKAKAPDGPIAVQLLPQARVQGLAAALGRHLGVAPDLEADRFEQALAYVYDASALGSGDCRAQAALLLLGFRDQRPAAELDGPLAFLAALALLGLNGFALDDVPYAEVAALFASLRTPRPWDQEGPSEAEDLHRWLQARTRPGTPGLAPLEPGDARRLLEAAGLKVAKGATGWEVSQGTRQTVARLWPLPAAERTTWEVVHALPDPGEGLLGLAACRDLRRACGLPEDALMDEAAWAEGWIRHHRHLWPRLLEAWSAS